MDCNIILYLLAKFIGNKSHHKTNLEYLFSIETKYLRANPTNDTLSAKRAFDNVKNLGQRGGMRMGSRRIV